MTCQGCNNKKPFRREYDPNEEGTVLVRIQEFSDEPKQLIGASGTDYGLLRNGDLIRVDKVDRGANPTVFDARAVYKPGNRKIKSRPKPGERPRRIPGMVKNQKRPS